MDRLKPMPLRNVPIFLVLALLLGCGAGETETAPAQLAPAEEYWVEQYLRIVEARMLAAAGDSLAEGRFTYLIEDLPADSLRALTEALSQKDPTRWAVVFEELVRRKKIMESQP
jgi:hypothetical protein